MTPLQEAQRRLCCHQLEHLLGSAASRASHCITFVLYFFKTFFFFLLPTPHLVSCITLLQSLFWARRDPGTHQLGSCHRRPQPVWIAAPFDWCRERRSFLPARKKIKPGRKKKQSSYFSLGDFSFLSVLSNFLQGVVYY